MANMLQDRLQISGARLDEINALLLDPESRVVQDVLDVVAKYGTPEEINRKAAAARELEGLMGCLRERESAYVTDVEWLIEQRDQRAFISEAEYRRAVLGARVDEMAFDAQTAVTLEISACSISPFWSPRRGRRSSGAS